MNTASPITDTFAATEFNGHDDDALDVVSYFSLGAWPQFGLIPELILPPEFTETAITP